jgi:hypothetical protein
MTSAISGRAGSGPRIRNRSSSEAVSILRQSLPRSGRDDQRERRGERQPGFTRAARQAQ